MATPVGAMVVEFDITVCYVVTFRTRLCPSITFLFFQGTLTMRPSVVPFYYSLPRGDIQYIRYKNWHCDLQLNVGTSTGNHWAECQRADTKRVCQCSLSTHRLAYHACLETLAGLAIEVNHDVDVFEPH